MSENKKLTELDIKYITKLIGRDINQYELRLVENVLQNDLNRRNYLGVLARLNKGAKRIIDSKIGIDEDHSLNPISDVQILNDNKLIYKDQFCNELINQRDKTIVYTIFGKKYDESVLKKLSDIDIKSGFIQFRSDINSNNDIIFRSQLNFIEDEPDKLFGNSDLVFHKIEIGNDDKKNRKLLNELIRTAEENNWFISAREINDYGINYAIIDELKNLKYGIKVENNIALEYLFQNKKGLSILTFSQSKMTKQIAEYCSKNGFGLTQIGLINNEQTYQLEGDGELIFNLPLSVFELQFDVNTKHFEQPIIDDFKTDEIIRNAKRSSFSNQLLKLFDKILLNNKNYIDGHINISKYGYEDEIENNIISVVTADYNNLLKIAPRMSAKIAVANATRKMSCLGIKPKYIQVHNLFPENNDSANWHGSEIMQGQEEAIRELELSIAKRSISSFAEYWQQNVSVIGFCNQVNKTDISFKSNGDFISLLGSHRGELVGTEYNRYINEKVESVVPTVDLNMEQRLQDVVQQGVATNLLRSATNVSLGGISIAIAMSLAASQAGIGAKIHLSRKLRDEELLFGETQGLVIVTLSEEDIMEFERICMTIGVPSTTIGRVTNTNQYTFNDLIRLDADKFRH